MILLLILLNVLINLKSSSDVLRLTSNKVFFLSVCHLNVPLIAIAARERDTGVNFILLDAYLFDKLRLILSLKITLLQKS